MGDLLPGIVGHAFVEERSSGFNGNSPSGFAHRYHRLAYQPERLTHHRVVYPYCSMLAGARP